MTSLLKIYETEQGDPVTISGKKADGKTASDLSWVIESDSTIEIKTKDVLKLTLVDADFSFADPTFTWTPTDAHLALLTKDIVYNGYVHARNNSTTRERVLAFQLKIINS